MNPGVNQNQPAVGSDTAYGSYGPQPAVASGVGYKPTMQDVITPTGPINNRQSVPVQNAQNQAPIPDGSQSMKKTTSKTNPNSTQNNLQIVEIRDGIVIMNDGSFRAVAMFRSINFDLMAQSEREAVEFSYQGFLNSLYFPIQISLHSQKVDLGPYLDTLSRIRNEHDNMLLALLMDDYIQFLATLSDQINIMDKKFYVVVPYEPNPDTQKAVMKSLNFFSGVMGLFSKKEMHVVINEQDLLKAKTELQDRMQVVLSGLAQCGVQGVPLDTKELIELYYDSYNPDTATRQELKNIPDLEVPIVSKGVGNAVQPNLDKEMY